MAKKSWTLASDAFLQGKLVLGKQKKNSLKGNEDELALEALALLSPEVQTTTATYYKF